jgi:hypothetical protein
MIKLNGSFHNMPPRQIKKMINNTNNNNNSLNHLFSNDDKTNLESLKLNLLKTSHMNRSNSVDLSVKKKQNTTINTTTTNDSLVHVTTSTLIELHKFLKEKQIYSHPNDNYKRRTIVLVRSLSKKSSFTPSTSSKQRHVSLTDSFTTNNNNNNNTTNNNNNGEFGFHLQTYGLVNSSTKQTEFICFVNNVQQNSPAQHAGLNNGDVILAIDGICIDEFKSLNEIMAHVRNKLELRLVIMCENICKKIQLKQRYAKLKQKISDKKLELERISMQEESIRKKYLISSPLNNTNNNVIIENGCFISPNQISSSEFINNSTPNNNINELLIMSSSSSCSSSGSSASSLALTPNILNHHDPPTPPPLPPQLVNVASLLPPPVPVIIIDDNNNNKSKLSSNGTARITVENKFTPVIVNSTSLSASSFESSLSSSSSNEIETPNSNIKLLSTNNNNKQDLILKQTPRMSRSALSSSMSFLSKLNNNLRGGGTHLKQTNPSSQQIIQLKLKEETPNNSIEKLKLINNNNISLPDSFINTMLSSSLSSSTTCSSLSSTSSSSVSPNLSLSNSITDNKSFNLINDIDGGVGVGIGLVAATTTIPPPASTATEHYDLSLINSNIYKYTSDNYVITRL